MAENEQDDVVVERDPADAHSEVGAGPNEWMTIEQVARHFNVPAIRVGDWIGSGVLTSRQNGTLEEINRSELDRVGNPDEISEQR